jgi:hypothetical protein
MDICEAGRSLNRASSQGNLTSIEDDQIFVLSYMLENGGQPEPALKPTRKTSAEIKDPKRAKALQEAEQAAETILRHRIAENERRHPEIFAQVRSPEFLAWFEEATGAPWKRQYESNIDDMRFQIINASTVSQKNIEISHRKC